MKNKVEPNELKSVVEIAKMKDIRHLLKRNGGWTKCNETILHFQ